jgi:hypothetical protein
MLGILLASAAAQDTPAPSGDGSGQTAQTQEPVPAYGQGSAPTVGSENPPLSGLDMPSLEPNAAPLSYLQPGATFSETADSNAASIPGARRSFSSITRALGSLELRRLWSHYDLALDYVGGAAYYSLAGQGAQLLQQMNVAQKISWKRGQLSLRDSFSYLPEGNFGGSYGALGSQGVSSLGTASDGTLFGGSMLGTLGLAPRIMNVSIADLTEYLTPKSSLTAAGGYSFMHFYGNDALGNSFIGGSQITGQAGYNRLLTAHSQVALVYAYQNFDFSVSGATFHSHVIQGMYGHRLSGRMDFLIGAGPQITSIRLCGTFFFAGRCITPETSETKIGAAGQVRLRYRFTNSSIALNYQRFETNGSGFFAGAQTDIASFTWEKQITRVWNAFGDLGYSRNSRLAALTSQQLASCVYQGQPNPTNLPLCPGVNANTYSYGFIGGGLRRAFGHDFHGYASYQFNELAFDNSYCGGLSPCSRISNRQVITFGLDWTPRPMRLD